MHWSTGFEVTVTVHTTSYREEELAASWRLHKFREE
jgi:hypothetical protein